MADSLAFEKDPRQPFLPKADISGIEMSTKQPLNSLGGQKTFSSVKACLLKSQEKPHSRTITSEDRDFDTWRDMDLITCLIALTSLILALVDYWYTFDRILLAFPEPADSLG
jgi:hypothetical protein